MRKVGAYCPCRECRAPNLTLKEAMTLANNAALEKRLGKDGLAEREAAKRERLAALNQRNKDRQAERKPIASNKIKIERSPLMDIRIEIEAGEVTRVLLPAKYLVIDGQDTTAIVIDHDLDVPKSRKAIKALGKLIKREGLATVPVVTPGLD